MTVSVEIEVARKAGALTLPLDAVRDLAIAPWVLAVRDGRARRVAVGVGVRERQVGDRLRPRRRRSGHPGTEGKVCRRRQGPGEETRGRQDPAARTGPWYYAMPFELIVAFRFLPRGALPDRADPFRRRRRGGGRRLSRGAHHRLAGRPQSRGHSGPSRTSSCARRMTSRGPCSGRRPGKPSRPRSRSAHSDCARSTAGSGQWRTPSTLRASRPHPRWRPARHSPLGAARKNPWRPRHRAGAVPEDRARGPQDGRRAFSRSRRGRGHWR